MAFVITSYIFPHEVRERTRVLKMTEHVDNRHLMQGHHYTLDANENSNDGGDEASFSIGSGVASWSNSNKRTAERKVRLLRCFTNSIPWVYVGHSGSVCISSTCGGYYKNKIFRTTYDRGH